ncbi:hypothetical protein SDC9_143435 [bioreactor metagenome]|uniref:Uncharacterized protein n=1 Tax=bioreactor metagenome TaxID=1076179 RepID=A0A645E3J2_9ZZZZ
MPCYAPRCFNNLLHGKSYAIAKVHNITLITICQVAHGQNMSLCQIGDMNIIAHTSAILCGIIAAKD